MSGSKSSFGGGVISGLGQAVGLTMGSLVLGWLAALWVSRGDNQIAMSRLDWLLITIGVAFAIILLVWATAWLAPVAIRAYNLARGHPGEKTGNLQTFAEVFATELAYPGAVRRGDWLLRLDNQGFWAKPDVNPKSPELLIIEVINGTKKRADGVEVYVEGRGLSYSNQFNLSRPVPKTFLRSIRNVPYVNATDSEKFVLASREKTLDVNFWGDVRLDGAAPFELEPARYEVEVVVTASSMPTQRFKVALFAAQAPPTLQAILLERT